MTSDVAQLVLQVDAQVAVAQRNLQQLARAVQQSSTDMNSSLGTTDAAIGRNLTQHHQLGLAFNNARIAQTELTAAVTRSVDAYGAGASPLRILSTEIGRLTEAAAFLGGGAGNGVLGSIVRFIGGPWGIALLLGGSILAKLATAHGSAKEAAEKHRDAEETLTAYVKGEDVANGSLLDSLVQLNKERSKALNFTGQEIRSEIDLTNAVLDHARANKTLLESQLGQAQVDLAKAAADEHAAVGGGKGAIEAASGDVAAKQAAVDSIKSSISTVDQAIGQATALISTDMVKLARDLSTHVGQANDQFDKQQAALEARYRGTPTRQVREDGSVVTTLHGGLLNQPGISQARQQQLLAQLEQEEGKLTVAREKGVAAARALDDAQKGQAESATHAAKSTGEFGRQIGFADAEAIARGAGLTVTSGQRTDAKQKALYDDPRYNHPGNPVARPVSMGGAGSAHEGLNGKWALDIAFAPGITANSLKKLYGDQGVSLSAVYKESGHYHIEGSTSQATAAERDADTAAQKQAEQLESYLRESAQLDAETLAARKQLLGGYDTQADIQADEVEAERQAQQAAIAKQLTDHRIDPFRAADLSLQADDAAAAKQAVIAHRKYADLLNQQAKAADQSYGFELDDLKFADDMAKSQAEHRKLQLDILDIQYKQKQADLEHLLATVKANKDFATSVDLQNQASQIQAQIGRLPTDKAHDQAKVEKGTMSPLEAYNSQLPHTLDQVKDRLQDIEVVGLKDLNDQLVTATTKALGLKGALGDVVGELLKLGLDVAEGAVLSALHIPARASGGPVTAGQAYIVGERRAELFVPDTNGMILPSVPKIRIPKAANDSGDTINVYQSFSNNFAGGAATQQDVAQMGLIARTSAIQAIREERRRSPR